MLRHGYNWDDGAIKRPFVSVLDGVNELLAAIPVAVKAPYERLGIVIDADTAIGDRWAAVRDRIALTGLAVPDVPVGDGTIVEGIRRHSRLGVWLMPDNTNPGQLEDFLVKLVPDRNTCWDFAREVTHEAARRGCGFAQKDQLKAAIHAW